MAIGSPVTRADALGKVTGETRYTGDLRMADMLHASLVTSTIARGRITQIDTQAAEQLEGVRLVLTHLNMDLDWQAKPSAFIGLGGKFDTSLNPLATDAICYHGQIIAMVVADRARIAEHAASLVAVEYENASAVADLDGALNDAEPLPDNSLDIGDTHRALADAPVTVGGIYRSGAMHHNPIELYGTTARWADDRLHVELPSQWIAGTQAALAEVFGLARDRVSVSSAFVGGAFGGKSYVLWLTVLTALAARQLARPVRLAVSRPQGFTVAPFRPENRGEVKLGADRDGRLLAYHHENWVQTSRADRSQLPGTHYSTHIYASPAIRAREYLVPTDLRTPGSMRGPIEYPVNFALEGALDELAVATGVDPVELRLRNEPDRDPVTGKPFSSRSLGACLRRGAELFGWSARDAAVGSMRAADGQLVGWGCAAAWYPTYRGVSEGCIRVCANGTVEVRVGAHDMGQGTYTVLAQIAADDLGVPLNTVSVRLGSSDLPVGPMAAGSSSTATAGSAVRIASRQMRERLLDLARTLPMFANVDPGLLDIVNGIVTGPDGAALHIATLVSDLPGGLLELTGRWAPAELDEKAVRSALEGGFALAPPFGATHTMFTFGAQFVEVQIDALTQRLKIGRMVGVFAGGRIINPRTARSQLIGGMIWGASHALMEESVIDRTHARFANTDLGSYHFAVNADIPDMVVEMLDEEDDVVNPLGAKGLGEIGVLGVAPAIAAAIHHATGVRLRKTPMLIDDLLAKV